MHRAHLQIGGAKIAKSDGNVVYLSDIVAKGIEPLALRYWLLTAHYRQPTNFTFEALEGAQTALRKLRTAAQKS
jgi:cysteinyl-tRNA synthetase